MKKEELENKENIFRGDIMKKLFSFIKDITIPITSILVMLYSVHQTSNINVNLTDTNNKENFLSSYEASEIAGNLADSYNRVIEYCKTDTFIEEEWVVRRVFASTILDDVFDNGFKGIKKDIEKFEDEKFKGLKNTEYEDSYYAHSNIAIYSDSIGILDPRIVKNDGSKEVVLKELPPRMYKVEKIKSFKDVEDSEQKDKFIIVDTVEGSIIDSSKE